MNADKKTLNVQDIQIMSAEQITYLYKQGYRLEEINNEVINQLKLINIDRNIFNLAYTTLDTKSCIATMTAALAGTLTIVHCPTGNTPGTTITIGATATNTGNTRNNSFVIGITATRADNGAVIVNGNSVNLDIPIGGTSSEFTLSFTMPSVNVNVVFSLQADPNFNY